MSNGGYVKLRREIKLQMKHEKLKLAIYRMSGGYSLLPFQFTVNISNVCNRRCKFCVYFSPEAKDNYYLQWIRKQPKFMDLSKFDNFLKRMGIFRKFIRKISLTGRGEPGLHPDLLGFCKVLNKYRIPFTLTSNGDKLDDEFFIELSKLPYCRYVRISLYDIDRAECWLNMKDKHDVDIDFINETGYHIDGYEDGYLVSNNPGLAKYATMPLHFVEEKYCRAPFSFNTLNTDGTLVTCIACYEAGNVFEEPFWKVWNSKEMRQIRKWALKMAIPKKYADCRNCGYFMRLPKYQVMNKYKDMEKR